MRTRHGAAAVAITASGAAGYRFVRVGFRAIVTVMRGLTPTAGMLRRDRNLQRDGEGGPEKREQEQKSGGQVLHDFPVNQNPKLS